MIITTISIQSHNKLLSVSIGSPGASMSFSSSDASWFCCSSETCSSVINSFIDLTDLSFILICFSNKLFIDNQGRTNEATARTSSLVYGVFDATPANQIFNVNGSLRMNNVEVSTGTVMVYSVQGTFGCNVGDVVEKYDKCYDGSRFVGYVGELLLP